MQEQKLKVYLTGGDLINWALDDDLRQVRVALQGTVDFTANIQDADVIHSMSWYGVRDIPDELMAGKRILCHLSGEPFRHFGEPAFAFTVPKVGCWIAQSRQAQAELESIGIAHQMIPYTADPTLFHPVQAGDEELNDLRTRWQIPSDAYLIGNFHRDTEGDDLVSPKLAKGPDAFAEIVCTLHKRGHSIHVVLAGPRRFWIRRKLDEYGVPYTFVGVSTAGRDDIDRNVLPQSDLNLLYNLIDVYVVSSRSEGGPRSILEASLAKCKIISSQVGIAPDVLADSCIYRHPWQAVELLEMDIQRNLLDPTIENHFRRAHTDHLPQRVATQFAALYAHIDSIPIHAASKAPSLTAQGVTLEAIKKRQRSWKARVKYHLKQSRWATRMWRNYAKRLLRLGDSIVQRANNDTDTGAFTVSLWHKFTPPPYGGGNQFMLALRKAMLDQNINVVENQLTTDVDAHVLNSVQFDIDEFVHAHTASKLAIVHRIDGPIYLARGTDRHLDELCFKLNQLLASATVVQSAWTFQQIAAMGYQPVHPTIIHNGVDPEIFHAHGRIPFSRDRKIRLLSSSWSDNARKGGRIIKWMDDNLDWNLFEYTFVGRTSEQFQNVQMVGAQPSTQLADMLRQHDIYIMTSQFESCSNALLEALACGLPCLYFDDSSNPEVVGFGGLPFTSVDEIPAQLEQMIGHYAMLQNCIVTPQLSAVAGKYAELLQTVTSMQHNPPKLSIQ